jgi:hypothetical protein
VLKPAHPLLKPDQRLRKLTRTLLTGDHARLKPDRILPTGGRALLWATPRYCYQVVACCKEAAGLLLARANIAARIFRFEILAEFASMRGSRLVSSAAVSTPEKIFHSTKKVNKNLPQGSVLIRAIIYLTNH